MPLKTRKLHIGEGTRANRLVVHILRHFFSFQRLCDHSQSGGAALPRSLDCWAATDPPTAPRSRAPSADPAQGSGHCAQLTLKVSQGFWVMKSPAVKRFFLP